MSETPWIVRAILALFDWQIYYKTGSEIRLQRIKATLNKPLKNFEDTK